MSERNVLDQERAASRSFLDQMLTAKDRAFLIHFDREVELLQDFTSSREKLQSALDLLHVTSSASQGGNGGEPSDDSCRGGGSRRMHRGGGTVLYDAVFLASGELMKKQQGRA